MIRINLLPVRHSRRQEQVRNEIIADIASMLRAYLDLIHMDLSENIVGKTLGNELH